MSETKYVRNEAPLPMNFINAVGVSAGLGEFFLTFGTAIPREISDSDALKRIDSDDVQPVFHCVITRPAMKQVIEALQYTYDRQTQHHEHKE